MILYEDVQNLTTGEHFHGNQFSIDGFSNMFF